MKSGNTITFIQPLAWKAKDENKVDEYLKVFVNPHVEWFDTINVNSDSISQVFLPVYFIDWLQSQLEHGTFHPEATVYAVFAVEAIFPNVEIAAHDSVVVNITSEYTPQGRTTVMRVKDADISAILTEDSVIVANGVDADKAKPINQYIRCLNAKGKSQWIEMSKVVYKDGAGRPSLYDIDYVPGNWLVLEHALRLFETAMSEFRRPGGVSNQEFRAREVLNLIRFKRTHQFRSVRAVRECFGIFNLVFRVYDAAVTELHSPSRSMFAGVEWNRTLDVLNGKLFTALHNMTAPPELKQTK